MYFVYLVECSDKSLYCGYTTDIDSRIIEHNSSKKGAKYTRSRRPVKLVYVEKTITKAQALKRENQIKRLSRAHKVSLMETKEG